MSSNDFSLAIAQGGLSRAQRDTNDIMKAFLDCAKKEQEYRAAEPLETPYIDGRSFFKTVTQTTTETTMTTRDRFVEELVKLNKIRPLLKKTYFGRDLWTAFDFQMEAISDLITQLDNGVLVRDLKVKELPQDKYSTFARARMMELEEWVQFAYSMSKPSSWWSDTDYFISPWEARTAKYTEGIQSFWTNFKAGLKKAIFVEK